jgi:uncharacterized protein YndB with AHSA1/START domain
MPATIDVDVSREMTADPVAIWAVLEDLDRLPEWLEFASSVQDVSGPAQPGARYTVKPPKSYEPTTHWVVSEVEAPSRQLHTSDMPIVSGVRSELQLSDGGGSATTLRVHWTGTPKGVMGKLMRGTMQKRITRNWERSLAKLDEVARAAT